ncbi:MAG: hypothetical protein BZ136_09430 [Methanosphaera sp. rholeuAM74]|nr:MAG: hypothetical protein BZ136_09430 [Methanosphaera sp. rholeuAM74]
MNITGSVLTNNTAINGSAIYHYGLWATIYNNTFVTNRASMLEKAIIDETGTAEIRDNVNDETSIDYGTIYTESENVSIIGNIFNDGRINTTITISSNNTNPMVTDKIKFTFTLKDQSSQSISNQKILVNIADRQYNLTTNTNGIATLDYTLAKVGTQAITAVYNGSTEYGPSNTTLNFTVNKKDTTITINDIPDTQYSDRVTITGGFTRSTGEAIKNATIVLTINGANYHYNTKTDVNGNYALNLTTNKLGTNNVTATFNGNSVYNSASTTKTFTVNKIDTVILLDDISDVEYSDTVAITGAFKRITGESIANVNIVLTVNGVMYKTKTDSNGNYTLNYTATKVGTNNVTASFNAISVYNRCNISKTFTVIKKDTSITLDSIPVADYSDKLTITGGFTRSTGEAIKNATIVLMINGAKYNTKTDANGNYALNYTATKVGTNNVTASFNGNSVYNSVNTSKTFTVNKKDTSIILNYIPNVQYSDKVVLAGKLTRSTGEKIANANIVVFINGVNYTTKTDANGNYALNYTATRVGTNNVAAWFAGNSVYNEVDTSRTFTVSKKDTSITLNYIADTPYSDKVTITGKFTRSTGEAVKNATITLMVNGVKYNTKTDANGNYALNYTATKVGTNNVTAIFNGNSVYNGADTSKTFTVTKKDTKITINSIATTKISNKVTITGKLTRSTGEVIKNATVTVKVNNVNYNVKTDANGLYTLNYTTNKVGTNNVTASFNGNSVYNSGSATRTFKVTN